MKKSLKVCELMLRERLRGEIVELFHFAEHRMIHGEERYGVVFNQESLVVGLSYRELSRGLRVTYGIFFATRTKIPTAFNVMPALGQTEETEDRENVRSPELVNSARCNSAWAPSLRPLDCGFRRALQDSEVLLSMSERD